MSRSHDLRAARSSAISQFTALLAHEMHQPLAAALTNASTALRWLDRPSPDLEEVRLAVKRIVRDADRATMMIARASARFARTPPKTQPIDINRLLREVLAAHDADRSDLRVETALDDALPWAWADPARVRQVADALIGNALDAMDEAKGRRHLLRLSSRLDGPGEIVVSIADSGIGLDVDSQQELFEPFYTTKADGLGLGLPLARALIEDCRGRLTAASNHPHGAVFTFTLPTAEQAS